MERFIENAMYASRWLLAPIYFGLSLGLLALALKFFQEIFHIIPNVFALADLKMRRLLGTFDDWAAMKGHGDDFGPPETFESTRVPESQRLHLDLQSGEIRTVIWATGFRPDYSWLDVPVVDGKGHLRHDGGVVESPGLYALGLPVLRRRKSTFIHGIEDDAREVIDHLAGHLAVRR